MSIRKGFFFAVLLLGWGATIQGQNLIENPGFEAIPHDASWQLWIESQSVNAMAVLSFPDTGAPEGSSYARVEVTSLSLQPDPINWRIQLQIPPNWMADSGQTYELKFLARSDSSSSIHVSFQDGPANNFQYRGGVDRDLTTNWVEQSLTHTSDVTGMGALRFNLYLGDAIDTYEFDAFSLQAYVVGTRPAVAAGQPVLRVRRAAGNLVLSLGGGAFEDWRAELFDLGGARLAADGVRGGGSLVLPRPPESGAYLIRVSTPALSWFRRLSL